MGASQAIRTGPLIFCLRSHDLNLDIIDSSRYLCTRINFGRGDEFALLTLSHHTLIVNSRKFVDRHRYVVLIYSLSPTTHSTRTDRCRSTVPYQTTQTHPVISTHLIDTVLVAETPSPPTTESTLFLQYPQALSKQPHTNRPTHARPHSQSTRRHM